MDRRDFLTTCSTLAVASAIGATPLAASTKMRYELLHAKDQNPPGWYPVDPESIRPRDIIRDLNGKNPSQMYEVWDPAEAWDLFHSGKDGLVLLPVGRDGKTIACREIQAGERARKETEIEVLVADIGGLVYEPIEMHQLERSDIIRFPKDPASPGEYQLTKNPTPMRGNRMKTDVYISYVEFPPGKEKWCHRVTKRMWDVWAKDGAKVSDWYKNPYARA